MTDMLAFTYSRPPIPPKMPQGLRELMEELTREVLRHGPEDVHGFCANHMKKLLEIRDGPRKMRPLTLQEKHARAQKILRYRIELRQKKMDKLNNVEACNSEEETVKPPVNTEKCLKEGLELELFDENSKIFERPAFIKQVEGFEDVKKEEIPRDQKAEDVEVNSYKRETEKIERHETNVNNFHINSDINKKIVLADEETIKTTKENQAYEIKGNKEENSDVISEVVVQNTTIEKSNTVEISEHKEKVEMVQDTENTSIKEAIITEAIETVEPSNENVMSITEETNKDSSNNTKDETEDVKTIEESNVTKEHEESVATAKTDTEDTTETNKEATTEVKADDTEILKIEEDAKDFKITDVTKNDEKTQTVNTTETNKEALSEGNVDDTETLKVDAGTKSPEIIEDTKHFTETDVTNSTENKKTSFTNVAINSNWTSPKVASVVDINTEAKTTQNIEQAVILHTDISAKEILTAVENKQTESQKDTLDLGSANIIENLSQKEDQSSTLEEGGSVTIKNEKKLMNEQKTLASSNDDEKSAHTENLQSGVSSSNDDTTQESLSGDDSQSGQTTMDLETAAITIQKVFRSFLFKSRNSTFDDGASDESTIDKDVIKEDEFLSHNEINKERRTLGLSRMDSVLQTVNEEKSLSLSTDDSSTLSSAATIIQAHVRGFLIRNRLSSEKTTSTNSLANSNPSESTDIPEQAKNKTVLNIHIVPESGHYVSRDDSLLASMELSMDGSPRTSSNLHPLGYDISERRKQLKREDAIQSVSPPSNNSGKLSEDVDSVKEMPLTDVEAVRPISADTLVNKKDPKLNTESSDTTPTLSVTEDTVKTAIEIKKDETGIKKVDLDEFDVVTPYQDDTSTGSVDSKLLHSGEFHDAVLPTKVSRNDSVIREFKNVLVYLLLWK